MGGQIDLADTILPDAALTEKCQLQFATLVTNDFISDLRCFYDTENQRLHSIVQLGRQVLPYNCVPFSIQKPLKSGRARKVLMHV